MYQNATYLIFLDGLTSSKKKKRVAKKLCTLCVTVAEIQSVQSSTSGCTFDDSTKPQVNTLYVYLVDGKYYNDKWYTKKKFELEREMILLLAGKLGVRELTYTCRTTEAVMSDIRGGLFAKWFAAGLKYTVETAVKNGCTGTEKYLNRGAPVYLFSKNINAVQDNIRRKLGSIPHIFSYEYYRSNPKLGAFVYKRYVYHMQEMDYTIDVEDISEKSFAVALCFMENGLQVKVDRKTCCTENLHYHFEFFTDDELMQQTAKDNGLTDAEIQEIIHVQNGTVQTAGEGRILRFSADSPRSEDEPDFDENESSTDIYLPPKTSSLEEFNKAVYTGSNGRFTLCQDPPSTCEKFLAQWNPKSLTPL